MDDIPEAFWQGVEQFNQRQFYACHDILEAIWIDAPSADKNFYQGILQVAVALYHLGNQNLRGAVILMGEGLNRLQHYQPVYADLEVQGFLVHTAALLKCLQHTKPDRLAGLVQQLGYAVSDSQGASAETLEGGAVQLPILHRVSERLPQKLS